MTRYIRLGYLVPRLVILVVLFAVAEFGSGWALRHALVSGGQKSLGAKVEIGDTAVSFVDARATLRDLRVANPQRPMENLLEAERIELDFEADSLLRRKAIAERGVVKGLRFGTPRDESGALAKSSTEGGGASAPAWLGGVEETVGQAADGWFAQLEDRLSFEVDELESIGLAKEFATAWPARFDAIEAEADAIRGEVDALRQLATEARSNPLRHADFLAGAPQRVSDLRRRIEELQNELTGLPNQVAEDRARVEAARAADERQLRERLQADQLDAQSLTSQLLGDSVATPLRELVGWVRWTREMIPPRSSRSTTSERSRGVDVHFRGVARRPDLLVRTLDLSGTARLAGRQVELSGVITDLTTSPELHQEPIRLALQTSGSLPLEVRASIHRYDGGAVDELLVDCPAIDVPGAELGDSDGLALSMAPSTGSLSISLRVDGERLSGDVQLVQDRVRMTSSAGPNVGRVAARLIEAAGAGLNETPKAATRVRLAGTLSNPEMELWSTLGASLAGSLEAAAKQVGEAELTAALEKTRFAVTKDFEKIELLVADATGALTQQIDGPRQELEALAANWIGEKLGPGTFSFEQLGKRLPAGGSLFR